MNNEKVNSLIDQVRRILPLQNPLCNFVHNNILMMFEGQKFEEGLKSASFYYGSKLFKDESFYLSEMEKNKITPLELNLAIENFLIKNPEFSALPKGIEPKTFYHMLMMNPLNVMKPENILWRIQNDTENFLTEGISEEEVRSLKGHVQKWMSTRMDDEIKGLLMEPELDDFPKKYLNLQNDESFKVHLKSDPHSDVEFLLLWCACWVESKKAFEVDTEHFDIRTYRRKRYFKNVLAENFEDYVQPILIRIMATYLDQGMSYWPSPYKNDGLWNYFNDYFSIAGGKTAEWTQAIPKVLKDYQNLSVEEIIQKELEISHLEEADWKDYILEILFDMRGWAGMMNKMEKEPHQAPVKAPHGAHLKDLIAINLICERVVTEFLAKKHKVKIKQEQLASHYKFKTNQLQNAYILFHCARHMTMPIDQMIDYNEEEIKKLVTMAVSFTTEVKSNIWHYAYEDTFYHRALGAFAEHNQTSHPVPKKPDAQVLFCMDDREESVRRYLEEIDPNIETVGSLGFFGLDMNFVSVDHPRKVSQCPPVVAPVTTVLELAQHLSEENYKKSQKNRTLLGRAIMFLYFHSRTLFRAQLATLILGFLSFIPLSFKIYHPRIAAKLRKWIDSFLFPEIKTHLQLLRFENTAAPKIGYSKEEMADRVATILKMAGLFDHFAPIVFLMAHGSSSVNNPFQLAYGCGACGGRNGHPNSRAFAIMVNDPEVRQLLKTRGINIPDSTYFMGTYHDTCADEVKYLDEELVPEHLKSYVEYFKKTMKEVCLKNSLERSRKFATFNAKNAEQAHLHAQDRSTSIAEPRPEYGHNAIAFAVIGGRYLTKDMFLDRRTFLLSYDPKKDPKGDILLGLMAASVPVCCNINMDYFFSCVDSEKYGCGSKLPLNVTSLMGVMTGSSSDLRIGLAEQMVELHEPMRITIIYECTQEIMESILARSPKLTNLIRNFWIRTVLVHPDTKELIEYSETGWKKYDPKVKDLAMISDQLDYARSTSEPLPFGQMRRA